MKKKVFSFILAFIICISSVLCSSFKVYSAEVITYENETEYMEDKEKVFLDTLLYVYTKAKKNVFEPLVELPRNVYNNTYDLIMSVYTDIAIKIIDFDYSQLLKYDPVLNQFFCYHDGLTLLTQYICESYTDGVIERDENGNYCYGDTSASLEYYFNSDGISTKKEYKVIASSFVSSCPIAYYIGIKDSTLYVVAPFIYDTADESVDSYSPYVNGVDLGTIEYWQYNKGKLIYNSTGTGAPASIVVGNITPLNLTYSIPIPVYNSLSDLEYALRTGDYTSALNYNPSIIEFFENTPIVNDIAIPSEKLIGFSDKVAEIDVLDLTPDEKYSMLLKYMNGETDEEETEMETESETESETEMETESETESETETESESETFPTGSDNSDEDNDPTTHSWLKKIHGVLEEILDKIKSIRRWVIADTIIDGVDLFADIGDLILNLLDEPLEAVSAIGKGLSGADSLLKNKFPFSIPWDIALLVGFLAHEPICPEFTLPLKLERYGIDEEIVLSLEEFEFISKLSRAMLTVTFCYGLAQLTMKIVGMKKGD